MDYTMTDDVKEIIKSVWASDKVKPIWIFCPICEDVLETSGMFGPSSCKDCQYSYQQMGSYASQVRIGDQGFGLDDMFDDRDKMYKVIAEKRALRKINVIIERIEDDSSRTY